MDEKEALLDMIKALPFDSFTFAEIATESHYRLQMSRAKTDKLLRELGAEKKLKLVNGVNQLIIHKRWTRTR